MRILAETNSGDFMRVLAIDPAARTGFAFGTTRDRVECSGVWSLGTPESRPGNLAEYIRLAVAKHRPDVIAYEVATMGGKHLHAMRRLNELAGVIQATAQECGCQAWAWNIMSWKLRAVGKGNASKADVSWALQKYFGIDATDDEADAVGIYLASAMGPPPESKKKQVKALAKRMKSRQPTLFGRR